MSRHLRLYLLLPVVMLFVPLLMRGQMYHHIPYTTSSVTVGGNTVTVTPYNATTQASICNLSNAYALQTGIGGTGSSFMFSFSAPASHIRIRLLDMNVGDFVGVKINSLQHTLQYSEVSPIDPALNLTCNNQTADSIENGLLTTYSPTSSQGRSAQIDLNPGTQINDFEFFYEQNPAGSGAALFEIYFVNDTCGANTLTATANTPCEGQSLNLGAVNVPPGVTDYSWSTIPPLAFSSAIANPTITNITKADAGYYYLTATRGNCVYTDDIEVKVKTRPVVTTISSSPAAPCPGQNFNLSADADSLGSTFSWTGPNSYTSAQQNPTVTNTSFLSQGTYSVVATYNGCPSVPKTTNVTLFSSAVTPTAAPVAPLCPGKTLNLSASTVPDPNATYLWIGPNNFSSTSLTPSISNITFADSGKYYVVSVTNGCQSLPDSVSVKVDILTPTPDADSAIVVCPGATMKLNVANMPGATFKWTGPAFPTPSPVQNPSVPNATAGFAGKYFVTATINGCVSRPDSTVVTLDITTPTPETDSLTIVCPNTTLKLFVDTVAGATYYWAGPAGFSTTGQYPTIPNATSIIAGKYYVRVNVNGCMSLADTTVVVLQITTPTPEAGSNGPICEGTNLQLTALQIPNASYKWKGPGGFSSNAQNPALPNAAPETAGQYIVEANVDGCISLPDTVTVDVKRSPTVTLEGDTLICENDTLNLAAISPQDGISYQWTLPSGSNFTEKYLAIANADGKAAGRYSVYVNHEGCQSKAPGIIDVRVKPLPAIPVASNNSSTTDSARKVGQEIKLYSENATPGITYSWTGPDGFTSTQQNPVLKDISKRNEGIYTIRTILDGCQTLAETEVFVSNRNYVVLYPNPNDGKFTLKASLGKDQAADLFIVNAVGQVVYKDKVDVKGKLLLKEFSLGANLSNGVYLLHIPLEGDDDIDLRFVITR
ncbi:T9SS type A sorting domain-containing protein [Polluticoccus soli]|uniref:T9SS type A sorting domain-containing protein n=1 Tax=Polluticoccus soli TaxID=3034150 RepID=UPI0023E32B38|nr:T9SS type A sorting domain-containing protein [Flavipsychrobacter sp. JY13-12]